MIIFGLVGLYVGGALNGDTVGGATLFVLISGIACIIYTIDTCSKKWIKGGSRIYEVKEKKWIIIVLVAWLAVGIIDFYRVLGCYEKPLFCIGIQTADDGGSGRYIDLGYGFDIKGNFVTEDEYRGVSQYVAYICGIEVSRNFME